MAEAAPAPATPTASTDSAEDVPRSGGAGSWSSSSQAGYLPIPLKHVPPIALRNIPVYLRRSASGSAGPLQFMLYRAGDVVFTQADIQRLMEHGAKFIYIRMVDQRRFRLQTEAVLLETVEDSTVAISETSAIIYETSVELVNELLSGVDLGAASPRLERVARAITTLVIENATAFSHLFAVSHHDFYTATHSVNVATWLVPLAYAMGHRDADELERICQAGLMHDMGKVSIPADILNKKDDLTAEEWIGRDVVVNIIHP